jgi:hypothetical protein
MMDAKAPARQSPIELFLLTHGRAKARAADSS